jgi:hypothetical protein
MHLYREEEDHKKKFIMSAPKGRSIAGKKRIFAG